MTTVMDSTRSSRPAVERKASRAQAAGEMVSCLLQETMVKRFPPSFSKIKVRSVIKKWERIWDIVYEYETGNFEVYEEEVEKKVFNYIHST